MKRPYRVRFSSLLDIDKITPPNHMARKSTSFSSLLDIDKITPAPALTSSTRSFSSLLDIDKITHVVEILLR